MQLKEQAQKTGYNLNYKTVSCKYYQKGINNVIYIGNCRFGQKCSFAHGDDEMRSSDQNIQYFQSIKSQIDINVSF